MGVSLSCPGGDDALDESIEALLKSLSFGGDYVKSTLRSVSFNGRDSEHPILRAWGSGKLIIEGSVSFKRREVDPFQLETKISIKSSPSSSEKENSTIRSPSSPERESPTIKGPSSSEKENLTKPTNKSVSFQKSRFSLANEKRKNIELDIPKRQVWFSPTNEKRKSVELDSPIHQAAVKLQKVYKSFRTRRQLADCAVLVEQRWWKLLDFALLKRSSVSFFDIEKQESAVSKWSRAKSRAAMVGKGLAKDKKAKKLALQHWLEAIDPRHRYGHNLHFYYDCWLRCESKQPFFYWLDVGEGKEVNIDEQCPRSKLQQQCIKYLGPKEREVYEVVVEDGKFLYKRSRELLDTTKGPDDAKWIFVLSTMKTLYVGQKRKGTFQHSSFLAGGATSAAGRLEVENGILQAVWPHSGHYRPTEENFQEFVNFLKENNVDLTDVKESPIEGEEEVCSTLRATRSEHDLTLRNTQEIEGQSVNCSDPLPTNAPALIRSKSFDSNKGANSGGSPFKSRLDGDRITKSMQIMPDDSSEDDDEDEEEEEEEDEEEADRKTIDDHSAGTQVVENEAAESSTPSKRRYRFRKPNLFAEEQEEEGEAAKVPRELILRRINSKKGMKSLQLGQQLSFKWTTGAGPRIGCVRDYPWELQFRALEQVSLSPKGAGPSRFCTSPGVLQSQGLKSPITKVQETSVPKENAPPLHNNRPNVER